MRRAVSNDIGPSRGPPTAEQLARLLAHDLRTPLNAIRGFADLVLAGAAGPLAAAQAELLTEIARAGRALEVSVGLAQELGEFHTTPVGEDAAVTLADMLQECGFVPATTSSEDAAERRLSEPRNPGVGSSRPAMRISRRPCRRAIADCHGGGPPEQPS